LNAGRSTSERHNYNNWNDNTTISVRKLEPATRVNVAPNKYVGSRGPSKRLIVGILASPASDWISFVSVKVLDPNARQELGLRSQMQNQVGLCLILGAEHEERNNYFKRHQEQQQRMNPHLHPRRRDGGPG
jgi:hypothetical protein